MGVVGFHLIRDESFSFLCVCVVDTQESQTLIPDSVLLVLEFRENNGGIRLEDSHQFRCIQVLISINNRLKSIPQIFARHGEEYFRDLESEVIFEVARENSLVIATGGGAVLRQPNVYALRQSGRIYFIDRPLSQLCPTEDRPLSSTREAIERRYAERYGVYCDSCERRIDANCTPEEVADRILEDFCK